MLYDWQDIHNKASGRPTTSQLENVKNNKKSSLAK